METRPMTSETLENKNHDLPQSLFSKKKKALILSVTLVLAVAAIVGACALALFFVPAGDSMASSQELNSGELSLEEKEKLHSQVVANDQMASAARRERRVQKKTMQSYCYSKITNDSTPIAHIGGSASNDLQWSKKEGSRIVLGRAPMNLYQTAWECDHRYDMVAGGMNFSKDTQELIVPTCGFYYFSSQVMFQYPGRDQRNNNIQNNADKSAQHRVEITPNCAFSGTYIRSSYSNLAEKLYHRTSTYLSDIFKMCEGGTIKILIPIDHNLCCAHGDFMDTFFSSFLIQKTSC